MQSIRPRRVLHLLVVWLTMCAIASPNVWMQTQAQTPTTAPRPSPSPTTAPRPSPSQQDATRPPGTGQRAPVPIEARPVTQDPTAPRAPSAPRRKRLRAQPAQRRVELQPSPHRQRRQHRRHHPRQTRKAYNQRRRGRPLPPPASNCANLCLQVWRPGLCRRSLI